MAKLERFLDVIGHYKYLITIVVGLSIILFLGENSVMNLLKLKMQKEDLQEEIDRYNAQEAQSKKSLEELKTNPDAVEKVARERYFMKKADEDVFVFSTDKNDAE